MTNLYLQIDDLQNALDNYVDAAIYHKSCGPDASPAYRDDMKLDLVTAIDRLITARVLDLVKVG
jgi:hypothetical protein